MAERRPGLGQRRHGSRRHLKKRVTDCRRKRLAPAYLSGPQATECRRKRLAPASLTPPRGREWEREHAVWVSNLATPGEGIAHTCALHASMGPAVKGPRNPSPTPVASKACG